MDDRLSELARFLTTLSHAVDRLVEAVTPYVEPVARGIVAMSEWQRISALMVEAGWLYHQTTPLDLIADPEIGADEVCNRLREYYEENWFSVCMEIESQLNHYDVDDEAKATVREALDAHGYGLYRSVCRLVFPEIERVLRIQLFGRVTGRQSYQQTIEGLFEDKALSDLLPGGWYEFDYLGHPVMSLKEGSESAVSDRIFGLFRSVGERDLPRLERDPVPNRHAAMHAYVSYSSLQNSLNAIFVADYFFRLVSSFGNIPMGGDELGGMPEDDP